MTKALKGLSQIQWSHCLALSTVFFKKNLNHLQYLVERGDRKKIKWIVLR